MSSETLDGTGSWATKSRSVIRLGKRVDLEVTRDGRVLWGYTDMIVLTKIDTKPIRKPGAYNIVLYFGT
jgi:hypothetical protein